MKRPPRIGWVREVSILLPLVTLLLVLVSTVARWVLSFGMRPNDATHR